MGTRCDFYVGRGKSAEWLGSYPWDGHPGSIPRDIALAKTEPEFRAAVRRFAQEVPDEFTNPEDGWPWPWETSATTDYAYAWDKTVFGSCFGGPWFSVKAWLKLDAEEDSEERDERFAALTEKGMRAEFPDMSTDSAAPAGSARSGVMLFGARRR